MKKVILFILLALTVFGGCGKVAETEANDIDDATWSKDHDTAPMPEVVVEEDDLIGYWTDDPYAAEPKVVEFYKENDTLKYRYFSVLLGNGNGFAIGKQNTIFEYNSGDVNLMGNQGSCFCLSGSSGKIYISFYCFDPEMKTIVDQEDGTIFYRWDDFSISEE